MGPVDRQRHALEEIRELLTKFVMAEIEASDFIPKYRTLFASFDPPDLTTGELTDAERRELDIYIRIMGGWFGEDDALIPKRLDWEYGNDEAPYAWIDGPAYREWISKLMAGIGVALSR